MRFLIAPKRPGRQSNIARQFAASSVGACCAVHGYATDVLTAAAGSIDISPSAPMQMGCGYDLTPTAEVRDPIEANVLVVRDEALSVALVSVDALYVGATLRSHLEEGLRDLFSPAEIFIGATHTHYAPFLDEAKPRLGQVNSEHLADVAERLVQLVRKLATGPCEPVTVEHVSFRTTAPIARRKRRLLGGAQGRVKFNSIVLAPNPRKTAPQVGHFVQLTSESGPLVLLWQLPCHPTSLPSGLRHSSHFPGAIRDHLRSQLGPEVPVLFFQGFSGDLRPPSVGSVTGAKSFARRIVLGPWFEPFTESAYASWLRDMMAEVDGARTRMTPVDCSGSTCLSTSRLTVDVAEVAEQIVATDARASWHRVSVGAIDLVGVSGEPVSEYAPFVDRSGSSPRRIRIPVGCIDDVFGYIPSRRMMREGGYEASGFCDDFGVRSLRPNIEGEMKRNLTRVLDL